MTTRKDIHSVGIPVLCISCEARHRGVCGALTSEQLVELAKGSTRQLVEAGSELASHTEDFEHYSNILSGVVKLTKMLPDGRKQIVGLQFAPDFVGHPFTADSTTMAEAATDVRLCSFSRKTVEKMMTKQPDFEHRLFRQTVKELDQARDWMMTLGRKNATEKVASFLLMIARNIDPAADPMRQTCSFELPLSRADIADFLGLTIETVSRQLTRLRLDGVIRVENSRNVVIEDLPRLAKLTGD